MIYLNRGLPVLVAALAALAAPFAMAHEVPIAPYEASYSHVDTAMAVSSKADHVPSNVIAAKVTEIRQLIVSFIALGFSIAALVFSLWTPFKKEIGW